MISEFKIGNFKAFGPAQTIPLRPITLVFGPNSAGKSSIIQSLLLARHIHDTGNVDAHQTTLGGAAVDLGGFAKYVRNRDVGYETTIRLSFDRAEIRGKFEEIGDFKALSLKYTIGKSRVAGPSRTEQVMITSVTMLLDRRAMFCIIRKEDGSLRMDVDAMRTRLEENRTELESDEDFGAMFIAYLSARMEEWTDAKFAIQGLSLKVLNPLPRENHDLDVYAEQGAVDQPGRDPHGFFTRVFKSWTDEEPKSGVIKAMVERYEFECLLEAANEAIDEAFKSASYLGPLRWIPPRLIPDGEQFDASWAAGGGAAWQRLRSEPELLGRVNRFLQETLHSQYRLRCQNLVPELDAETFALCIKRAQDHSAPKLSDDTATSRVAEDAQPYGAAKADAPDFSALQAELLSQNSGGKLAELSLVDAESGLAVSHRDVGTGISQILPVLVNAAGGKNQLIAIEQPELHLHPALQAELGDVFIESALGENKNTFLIETHSEHLILRLLRRIRETAEGELPPGATPLRPEDVAVLYVKPGSEGSEVIELPVNLEGDFDKPWPDGFFHERAKELF